MTSAAAKGTAERYVFGGQELIEIPGRRYAQSVRERPGRAVRL